MKPKRLKVEDLMTTAVIAIKETTPIETAMWEMQMGGFRHVPVVDGKDHVVGILSSRDFGRLKGEPARKKSPVGDIMTRTVQTIHGSRPAHEAATIMLDSKVGSVPVVGDEEQLVGIITETDFLYIAREALLGADL